MDEANPKAEAGAGPASEPAPVRRRVLVLLNPRAGRRRSLARARRRIEAHDGLDVDLIVPDPSDHAAQIAQARQVVQDGVDAVVVRGGDGMVAAGLSLVAGVPGQGCLVEPARAIPLGVIPAGTGNDFARAAGLPRRNPRRALDAVLDALEAPGDPHRRGTPVDALRLRISTDEDVQDERWVANSVNIGFDAQVNLRANALCRVPGSLRYLVALAGEVRRFQPLTFEVSVDEEPAAMRESALICVQNGPSIGGGIPLAPGAGLDDARAEASFVAPLSRAGLLALFPLVYLRAHRLLRPLRTRQITRLRVKVPAGVPLFADGDEVLADDHPGCEAEVAVVPGAVRLLR